MGGGRGTRLYPLTMERCKPAVPLAGKYRLVDIPISNCLNSGINRIFLLTQFHTASLHRHIQSTYHFDVFDGGFVDLLSAEQTEKTSDWYQGTADAVRKQLRHVRDMKAKYYLILSGDQLYHMDYRALMQTHIESEADITVAALPISWREASRFGIMRVHPSGHIREFVEKPTLEEQLDRLTTPPVFLERHGIHPAGRDLLASMGVYLFRASVLEHILEHHLEMLDFGRHIIPQSLRNYKVFAHVFNGFWEDIGTVRTYYEVHMQMAGPNPPFDLFTPEHIIYTHPRYLPGTRCEDVQIANSILCEGCRISKAKVADSVIGIRSQIRNGVTIERSVIMGADYLSEEEEDRPTVPLGIGDGTTICQAIIDKNAHIGKNVVIRGSKKLADCDRDGYVVRDGIVIVLKNAVIPDNARIE